MSKQQNYVVGIDIGSSKVFVLIGQDGETGALEVVGKGVSPNRGARRGSIVNVELTVEALRIASEFSRRPDRRPCPATAAFFKRFPRSSFSTTRPASSIRWECSVGGSR